MRMRRPASSSVAVVALVLVVLASSLAVPPSDAAHASGETVCADGPQLAEIRRLRVANNLITNATYVVPTALLLCSRGVWADGRGSLKWATFGVMAASAIASAAYHARGSCNGLLCSMDMVLAVVVVTVYLFLWYAALRLRHYRLNVSMCMVPTLCGMAVGVFLMGVSPRGDEVAAEDRLHHEAKRHLHATWHALGALAGVVLVYELRGAVAGRQAQPHVDARVVGGAAAGPAPVALGQQAGFDGAHGVAPGDVV